MKVLTMFYTREEYRNLFNIFLNERKGNIVKLKNDEDQIFGNLIRSEIKNDDNESIVIINLALDERYKKYDNDDIKFSIKDLKYFEIKHLINFDINKYENSYIDLENIEKIIEYINMFEIKNDETIKYILKNILNIKNYYKNKKIKLLLI